MGFAQASVAGPRDHGAVPRCLAAREQGDEGFRAVAAGSWCSRPTVGGTRPGRDVRNSKRGGGAMRQWTEQEFDKVFWLVSGTIFTFVILGIRVLIVMH